MNAYFERLRERVRAANQRDLDYDHNLRLNPGNQTYWSDRQHLADKLRNTIEFVASHDQVTPELLTENFAIVQGTGQVVRKVDGEYHYVEIVEKEQNPIYVSPKATLPESQLPLLKSVTDLGIV